jgi:predicted PurR-regulated permease PerM
VRVASTIRSYDTDVAVADPGSPVDAPTDGTGRYELDPRAAIPLSIAFALLAFAVWFIRSIPRTLASAAIAALIALALNPIVEVLKRRMGWQRRTAVATVILGVVLIAAVTIALITVPTIREVRGFNDQIPKTVRDLGDLPIVGPRLREAHAAAKVQKWLNDAPKHLSANSKPIENAAGAVADGVAAALFYPAARDHPAARRGISRQRGPAARSRETKSARRRDRPPRLQCRRPLHRRHLVRRRAGGIVMLSGSLALGVPLAPLIAVWVAITNPIPQVGGFLGGAVFVRSASPKASGRHRMPHHLLDLPTAREPCAAARHHRPRRAALSTGDDGRRLIGVSAGGLVGGLFAIPLLGASKAIYLSTRRQSSEPRTAEAPAPS